jgi:signal transduction histidine kinase
MLSEADLRYRESTSARQLVQHIMNSAEVQYERVFITRTGKRIPVEITARRINVMGEALVLMIAHDVTSRKKSERALREGQERLRDLLSHSPMGLAIYNSQFEVSDVNQACLRMLGIPDAVEFRKFNPFDNPFMPAEVRHQVAHGESCRYEALVDFAQALKSALFVTGRTGTAYFDIVITDLGVDADYNPKGYLVEMQDITRRREAEASIRRMERQLRQSQKMEAIGSLSGGIAHDFNNILTPLLGYTEMLREMVGKGQAEHEYVEEILKACNRAKELVNQILTFSRQTDKAGVPVKVTPVVKEVLKLISGSLPSGIAASYINKAERDSVLGDPTHVHQILMNLCTNAVHAMRGSGGNLEIRLTNFLIEHRSRSEFPHLKPGSYLRISVKDSGCGMDQDTAERIFEPFFTTKVSGEGTGMGLAVVHGIVTSMNGAISVETAPGKGSTFHVALPTMEDAPTETAESSGPLPRGTERILFVDDERDILKMAGVMLATLGYDVATSPNPTEALARFRAAPDEFDLVITDQVMPEMRGDQMASAMLNVRPDIPIILCTGFSETITAHQARVLGIKEFIMKPIVQRHLADAIRRALD